MSKFLVLGIESTCDETAAAVVSSDGTILTNVILSQIDHSEFGGIVPSIAAGYHVRNLRAVVSKAMIGIDHNELSNIFVSTCPGLISGLVIGSVFSQTLAHCLKIPVNGINHLEGHILSGELLSTKYEFPCLVLLVTGGHSMILFVKNVGHYEILSQTIDDAIGEVFDKVARMLGFSYPGGPSIERAAKNCGPKYDLFNLPTRVNYGSPNLSFSGLKTASKLLIEKYDLKNSELKGVFCATFQDCVSKILIEKLNICMELLLSGYANKNLPKRLFIVGGVAANFYILESLKSEMETKWKMKTKRADMKFCTDNGAMIAWAGIRRMEAGLDLLSASQSVLSKALSF